MKRKLVLLLFLIPCLGFAQVGKPGRVSLGLRSSLSLFNHGSTSDAGYGMGGHIRVQLTKRVNTEWFADYLTSNAGIAGYRRDGHIGWSVMYYLSNPEEFQKKLLPYLLVGHCFDYTRLTVRPQGGNVILIALPQTASRWSSAIQAGMGSHYNIAPQIDISLTAQYMMHLGNDLEISEKPFRNVVEETAHAGIEGHLLVSLSANFKLMRP